MDCVNHMFRKAIEPPIRLQDNLMYWENSPDRFWLEGNGELLTEVNDWLIERKNYSMEAVRGSSADQAFGAAQKLLRWFVIADETDRIEFILRFSR